MGKPLVMMSASRDVENTELAQSDALTNEVDVELDVFRPAVVHWVDGEVDGGDVVAIDNGGLVHRCEELAEELMEPDAFGGRVSHAMVLSLCTRARDRGLALQRPGDEGVAEVDAEARGRSSRVGAARPIRISVCTEIQCG